MHFEIVGEVTEIEVIAEGRGIRRLKFLRKRYGGRRWRKLKGVAGPLIRRLASTGGGALVRSPRRRSKGSQDQAVS